MSGMGVRTRPRKTVEDYMNLPDGVRAELIEGELFMSPSPKLRHQKIAENLLVALRRYVDKTKRGAIHIAPLDVHLPSGDVVQPDLIFVADANRSILQDWIRGVPDLLIEVVSPDGAERDRIVKRDLYARNGVAEYWIVDDQGRAVEVLRLQGDAYEPAGYFTGVESVRSVLLSDLALPLADVFA
jgi:Uma2 family endonuclease